MIQQIPNLISVLRLLLVPWFAMLLLGRQFDLALFLFVLMGMADGLDGFLARVLKATSPLGATLDPLADKVMLIATFVILMHLELLPVWAVTLIVARDALIVGGCLLRHLFRPELAIKVIKIGKVNTFLQICVAFSVIASQIVPMSPMLLEGLLGVTVGTTLVSGIWYMLIWGGLLAQPERA